ncbi:glycosyltransferase family 4 protein [Streptomyces wedmorensis]|uniref:glycosyltransferase family 4 protein n=1 Tax=Streptomyces wedmorensis TaxID=43759 RepID=UPI00379944AC
MKHSRPVTAHAGHRPRRSPRTLPEPFLAARAGHWGRSVDGSPGWSSTPNLLAELVRAEYHRDGPAHGPSTLASPQDLSLAGLRRRLRLGKVPTPEECVRFLEACGHTRAAVFDAWPDVVRLHGPMRSQTALRTALRAGRAPEAVPQMLDLAAAAGLRPLTRTELVAAASGTAPVSGSAPAPAPASVRRVRHAAWRLLASMGERSWIPDVHEAADAYERALLTALGEGPPVGPDTADLRPGLFVAQSMLMGHLDRPGEGMSGGLGVLLGSLGDALADTGDVGGVLTVVTADTTALEADPLLLRRRGRRHWVLRIPVDSDHQIRPEEAGTHREAMAWWATVLLTSLRRPVDVLHVRYADDGSLALAEAARRAGTRLVFTATPDPHRQMTERYDVPAADPHALRDDLHRVFLADRLVERADRVVGIAGRDGGAAELVRYFPQLVDRYAGGAPSAPPEGIPPYSPPAHGARRRGVLLRTIDAAVEPDSAAGGAASSVLLSVGRLHPVKQQDLLVRSWIASGCHRHAVLVLVGGSPHSRDPVERMMRARIEEALRASPEARRRLLLLPALPNAEVRMLERALADPTRRVTARYVCPSAKEEFGLALLEAMEAGLLVAGPLRGGVPHYVADGRNGLLIDTSTSRTLGEGLTRLLAVDDEQATTMAARARSLVRSTYSSTAMARALAEHYAAVTALHDAGADGTRHSDDPAPPVIVS